MASEKITAIVESVKTMTVLELKELVDTICEEFGVSAVAAAAPAAPSTADELLKFKQLLDMGAITEAEYNAKKAQLLGL